MRVLQINLTCGVGSTGRIVEDIAKTIELDNDTCYIAYGYYNSSLKNTKKIRSGSSVNSVRYDLLNTRLTGWNGFSNKRGTKELIRWIGATDPDIIHLHNTHGGYLDNAILFNYLRFLGKPVVWTLHDCWAFTGHCAYFNFVGCDKWKTGCNHCPNLASYPKSIFFDRSEKQWKIKKEIFNGIQNLTIVTPSKWLGELVGLSYLKEYSRIIIHNGIDTSVFRPTDSVELRNRMGLNGKRIILGVAQSWSPRKGLPYFLELAHILPKDFQIILIGLNNRQLRNIPRNIIGFSQLSGRKELAEFYSLADVFINPTLEDNYPTTNLEAQACGTPVVTFNTGGSPESIVNGIVTPTKNVDALVNAVNEICSYPFKNRQMKADFSKEYSAKQYYNLYLAVMRGNVDGSF